MCIRDSIDVPPPAVKRIARVQHITALGVTLSLNFSMTKHIDTVMAGCVRILYGLRILPAHSMPQACLQFVFRSTALTKLLYASPASEKNRLRGFLETSLQIRLLYRWFSAHCCCTLWTGRRTTVPLYLLILFDHSYHPSAVHHIAHVSDCITMNFPLK